MRSQPDLNDNDPPLVTLAPLMCALARLRIASHIICAVNAGELDTESLGSAVHMARSAIAILEAPAA